MEILKIPSQNISPQSLKNQKIFVQSVKTRIKEFKNKAQSVSNSTALDGIFGHIEEINKLLGTTLEKFHLKLNNLNSSNIEDKKKKAKSKSVH